MQSRARGHAQSWNSSRSGRRVGGRGDPAPAAGDAAMAGLGAELGPSWGPPSTGNQPARRSAVGDVSRPSPSSSDDQVGDGILRRPKVRPDGPRRCRVGVGKIAGVEGKSARASSRTPSRTPLSHLDWVTCLWPSPSRPPDPPSLGPGPPGYRTVWGRRRRHRRSAKMVRRRTPRNLRRNPAGCRRHGPPRRSPSSPPLPRPRPGTSLPTPSAAIPVGIWYHRDG
jgi:hypothetical protein